MLSPDGVPVPEDFNPSPQKIKEVEDGYLITNITGIRAHFVSRLDGKGYDIVKRELISSLGGGLSSSLPLLVAQHPVRHGQIVYLSDPALTFPAGEGSKGSYEDGFPLDRSRDIKLHFHVHADSLLTLGHEDTELTVDAFPASFGGTVFSSSEGGATARKATFIPGNPMGCSPYDVASDQLKGVAWLVRRGQCTFLEKLVHAVRAGAAGVIVISA